MTAPAGAGQSQRLSPHFNLGEFACHDGTPVPAAAVPHLRNHCLAVLEPLRERYGPVYVTSGFRHAAYNTKIGGARQSFHIYGLRGGKYPATDVHCARGSIGAWHIFVERLLVEKFDGNGGLGFYPRGGFIHIDLRPYDARWDGP
jgi:uncharacterized protein YcbK (DUF882 family)